LLCVFALPQKAITEMTNIVSSGALKPTHSLTPQCYADEQIFT